jgi:uncharacterized protein (TIGR03084 family)
VQANADAFAQECDVLDTLLSQLTDHDWQRPTLFKQWTADDILVHLHFWNRAADLSLHEPDAFERLFAEVATAMKSNGLRTVENNHIEARGADLLHEWRQYYLRMVDHWATLDPKHRVKWAGPDMSVRSSMTARQMETWAHGQALFDLFGQQREESDRIENIVVLGVNTFGWTYKVRGQQPPGPMPQLKLTSPEGHLWTWGDSDTENLIEGSAVGFAQTVTQTRNVADTDLQVTGPIATDWMANAQCFAGAAVTPPAAGARYRQTTD